tara:strand:+ start:1668 stop:1955 length:288 start_codon:yes stop_codon:yes gene_type:complete
VFLELFKIFSNISRHTELVEACDWSEERAQEVLELCDNAVAKIREDDELISSYSDFEKKIRFNLRDHVTLSEIDILLKLLEESLNHPQEGNIIWE